MSVEPRPFLSRLFTHTLPCLALALAIPGCAKEDEKKPKQTTQPVVKNPAVARCQQGIVKATRANDLNQATRIYFESCAGIHEKPGCQKAWKKAATAPPDEQLKVIAMGCKDAYCDELGKKKYALCKADLKPTTENLKRAWPPFHDAILRRDVKGDAQQLRLALLSFYAHRQNLAAKAEAEEKKAKADASSGEPTDANPPTAASANPSAAGSARPSAPPGSAAPKPDAPAAKPKK